MITATMTRTQLIERIETLKPGEHVIYHLGSLMYDRATGANFAAVHATACAAWDALEEGKVALAQRLVSAGVWENGHLVRPSVFEYRLVKLTPPYKAIEWAGPYATNIKRHSKPATRTPVVEAAVAARAMLDAGAGAAHVLGR